MRRFAFAFALAAMWAGGSCFASEWKSLDVVDASTLVLHFDDLESVHFGVLGGGMKDQKITQTPLDLQKAGQLASYTVDGATPTTIGRKTRPHTFVRAANPKDDHSQEHFIYILLQEPLKPGAKVTVTLADGLVSNGPATMSLTFDPTTSRTEAIHTDQMGYMPADFKVGYVSDWLGDLGHHEFAEGSAFHVLDATSHKSVFDGTLKLRKKYDEPDSPHANEGNQYRTDLYECDFTALKTPGSYVLSVDGVGCSYAFDINADIYRHAYETLMKGVYLQRCGTELKEPFTEWPHPACHTEPLKQTDHRYMDQHFSEGPRGPFKETGEMRDNVAGGWHDAGDWDREGTHADIPSRMLIAYELTPDHYADGELNIPESGNGIPDLVDEAAWGVDYYRRLQRPEGGVSVGMFESGNPKDGQVSWTDTNTRYCYAEEPLCTYKQAAAAAHMAITLKKLGKADLAAPYLDSARRAFKWAGENLRDGDEPMIRDDRFHAAVALYRATGEVAFQESAKKDLIPKNQWEPIFAYPKTDQTLGVWSMALAEDDLPGLDKPLRELCRKLAVANAQHDLQGSEKHGGRAAYEWYYPLNWGRGAQVDNLAMMVANTVAPNPKLLDAMVANANCSMGCNPLNMVWVTGLGQHSPKQVMMINTWFDSRGVCPGVAPAGPFAYDQSPGKGVWQIGYAWKFVYPNVSRWPPLELWFEDRLCPPTNEHVVEKEATMAFSLGYLMQPANAAAK